MSRIELERLDQRPPYWIASDPAFDEALLREGNTMLAGDVDTGKAILRDYIKATVGFESPSAPGHPAQPRPHPWRCPHVCGDRSTRQYPHWSRARDDRILAEYGLPPGPHQSYEVDHLMAYPHIQWRLHQSRATGGGIATGDLG